MRVHLYIDEDVKGAEGNHTNVDIDESDPRSDVAIKDNLHGLDKESVTPEMYPCRKVYHEKSNTPSKASRYLSALKNQ